jgi:hypothetical protein
MPDLPKTVFDRDEHGGRYDGQTQRAIDAGLSAVTVESVRQGCYTDAQLDGLIHDLKRREGERAHGAFLHLKEVIALLPDDELSALMRAAIADGWQVHLSNPGGSGFVHGDELSSDASLQDVAEAAVAKAVREGWW